MRKKDKAVRWGALYEMKVEIGKKPNWASKLGRTVALHRPYEGIERTQQAKRTTVI